MRRPPSAATSIAVRSSRMLTSTPGRGSPAWVRAAVVTSSSAQSRMRSWGQATEASGEVSVIPQAWMMRRPNSAAIALDQGARRLRPAADDVAEVGQPSRPGGPARRRCRATPWARRRSP